MSFPLLAFCAGLHPAAVLCAKLQLCPGPSFHGVSMEQNLSLVSEVRLTGRRGAGVWDEEQPHNVPHFCWKYIDATEPLDSPWDAWLRAEAAPDPVACRRVMGLIESVMLSAASPWLLAALWLCQSACARCSPSWSISGLWVL